MSQPGTDAQLVRSANRYGWQVSGRNAIKIVDGWSRGCCCSPMNPINKQQQQPQTRLDTRANYYINQFIHQDLLRRRSSCSSAKRSANIIQIIKQQIISMFHNIRYELSEWVFAHMRCIIDCLPVQCIKIEWLLLRWWLRCSRRVIGDWVTTQLKWNCEPVNVGTWKLFRAVFTVHLSLLPITLLMDLIWQLITRCKRPIDRSSATASEIR